LLALVREVKRFLYERFHPNGYNIDVNVGEAAGQSRNGRPFQRERLEDLVKGFRGPFRIRTSSRLLLYKCSSYESPPLERIAYSGNQGQP